MCKKRKNKVIMNEDVLKKAQKLSDNIKESDRLVARLRGGVDIAVGEENGGFTIILDDEISLEVSEFLLGRVLDKREQLRKEFEKL